MSIQGYTDHNSSHLDINNEYEGSKLGQRNLQLVQIDVSRTVPYLKGDDCTSTANPDVATRIQLDRSRRTRMDTS